MEHGKRKQRTWNSPEQIAEHRAMSVEERIKRCIKLSRAALKFSTARPVDRDR